MLEGSPLPRPTSEPQRTPLPLVLSPRGDSTKPARLSHNAQNVGVSLSRGLIRGLNSATSAAVHAASSASTGSSTAPAITPLLHPQQGMEANQNRVLWFLHHFPRAVFQSAETQLYLVAKTPKKKKNAQAMMVWKGKAPLEMYATLQYKGATEAVNETRESFEPEWDEHTGQVAFKLRNKYWTVADDSTVRLLPTASSFDRRWFQITLHGDFFSLQCPVSTRYLGVNVDDHLLECRQSSVSTAELLRLCIKGGIRSKSTGRFLTVRPESVQAPCTASAPGGLETLIIEVGGATCRIYSCAGVSQRSFRRYLTCWKDQHIEGTWHLGFPLHGHSQSDMGSLIEEQFEIVYTSGNCFTIRACNDLLIRWDGSRLQASGTSAETSCLFEIVSFHKTRKTPGTPSKSSEELLTLPKPATETPSGPPPVPPRTYLAAMGLSPASPNSSSTALLDNGEELDSIMREDYRKSARIFLPESTRSAMRPANCIPPSDYAQDELLFKEEILSQLADLAETNRIRCVIGTLFVTNYRLFFVPELGELREKYQWSVPLGSIEQLNSLGLLEFENNTKSCFAFEVFSKHWIQPESSKKQTTSGYHFLSTSPVGEGGAVSDPQPIIELIKIVAFPLQQTMPLPTQFFAFAHRSNLVRDEGWSLYSVEKEFERQIRQYRDRQTKWAIFEGNRNFAICPSYPELMVQPHAASEAEIAAIALHRSKKRIPAVTWIHPTNGAAFLRCSQPMQGFRSSKSSTEEKYFALICSADNPVIWIMDARPQINAMANRLKGAGYEDIEHYRAESYSVKIKFLGIGNIHVMRDSLKKLRKLCESDTETSNSTTIALSSCWLDHVALVLRSGCRIAEKIHAEGQSVVLHCSDGWDRTAQLASIGQLIMDGYFRTIRGFCVLIEKDWLGFGHKFADRTGQGDEDAKNKERSPIFIQFIDCVWQLTQQFPTFFEFNQWFLLAILEHLTSNRFGTFLYNTEQERKEFEVRNKTHSLWHILLNRPNYLNQSFESSTERDLMSPRTEAVDMKLWELYYVPTSLT